MEGLDLYIKYINIFCWNGTSLNSTHIHTYGRAVTRRYLLSVKHTIFSEQVTRREEDEDTPNDELRTFQHSASKVKPRTRNGLGMQNARDAIL
jgi:hypothetical protein